MSLDRTCRNGYVRVCLTVAGLVLGLAVSVSGQTTSTWNNLGGDGEYANPANWNPVVVPLNDGGTTYLVVIPASASVSYDFPVSTAGTVTSLTLGAGGTLTIDPAESLTVLGDADVAGRIVADAGTFSAGAGSQFVGNKATLAASNGGNLTLPATSYSSTGITGGGTVLLFSATGAGSVLDLSSLESLADNHSTYNGAQVHQVSATNDGVVNLSSLQQVSGPTLEEGDRLEFVVNTGGNIVLTALQSTTAGTGEVRFSIDVPSYTLPALQTAVNTQFNVSGTRTLNLPALVSHDGQGYALGDGATVNAPALASLTNAVLTLGAGSVLAAPNLTDVSGTKMDLSPDRTVTTGVIGTLDNARISVSGGLTFGTAYGDVSATSYASTGIRWGGTEVLFSATGPGSVLDLSSLESLADNHSTSVGDQVHQVSATNGGVVDLSKVQQASGPTLEEGDRLEFVVNTGGNIVLTALQSTTAGTGEVRFSIDVPSYTLPALQTAVNTQFNVSGTRTLNLPALVSHDGQGYALGDGATVNAPALASLTNAGLTLGAGSVFAAPNLTDVSGTKMDLSPDRTVTTGVIGTLNNARISVSGGLTFGTAYGDVSATSYASTGITWGGAEALFSATGPGSVLDLSSLESLADNHSTYNGAQVHQVSATNGGVVDLSSVQQASGPTLEEQDRLEFVVNTGGNIVLTALQSTTAGTGEVRFSIDVPAYTLPALQTAVNTQFNVSGTRTLNLPALVSHNGQGYTLCDGATVNAPALASLTNAVLTLGAGSALVAPNLTDISGTKVDLSPGRTVTTGVIGTLNNARISVSGGITFGTAYGDVSATSYASTGITWGGTEALFSATGPGSVLDLSSLESLADNHSTYNGAQIHQVSATNGGVVNLSKVQHISGPLLEAQDRLDFIANTGGRIDLSSLQSITTGTGKVRFLVSAGGQLSFGDLTITDEFSLSVTDATSRVTVGDLYLDPTSNLTVGGGAIVALGGHFSFDYTEESRFACNTAIFQFDGNGTQWMEVGGDDLGLPGPTAGNFGITQLIVGAAGRPTDLILVDLIDNGNRHSNEALYLFGSGGLDGLEISTGSRLIIGDINVYALVDGAWVHFNEDPDLILNGSIPYDGGSIVIPEPATLALLGAGLAALVLRRRGR